MSGLAAGSLIIVLTEMSRTPVKYTYFLNTAEGYQWLLLFLVFIITSSGILKPALSSEISGFHREADVFILLGC
jgi:hypothetical protein